MFVKEILRKVKTSKLKKMCKKNENIVIENINIQLDSDIQISNNSECKIQGLTMNRNCALRVRDNSKLEIGKDVYFNNNCIITCRKYIKIGSNTSLGPNILIFDHDHDYKHKNVSYNNNYICKDIIIGNNVWIGGNSVILAGTKIGDNCVIGAGSIVKDEIPSDTIFYNKRFNEVKEIIKGE